MSSIAISYNSLKDASGEARDVSRKLTDYANSLDHYVYKKINSYSGMQTQNVYEARNSVGNKISELRNRAGAYSRYSADLSVLKENCESVDTMVKGLVSRLTGSFKDAHGISNSKVQNTINYFLVSWDNSSARGRWLGDEKDKWKQKEDYIKQSIEDWWDYQGGKQLVKGLAIAVLEVVAGIATVVGAIASIVAGGWTIALVATLIGGVIAIANGIMNGINEKRAYDKTQDGDPAAGRRLSDENTMQDTIRAEAEENVSFWYKIANGIDIVNLGCAIVSIVSSCGKLVKNAYKWTTGSTAKLSNLRIKNILTIDNVKAFGDKIKLSFKLGMTEIKSAIRMHDFTNIKSIALEFGSDFMNNLKDSYFNFEGIKNIANSIGNIASIPKDILKGGLDFKNLVVDVGFLSVILPNLSVLSTDKLVTYDSGKLNILERYDFQSFNLLGDLYDIGDKFMNKIIKNDGLQNLISKLSTDSNINISVPKISIPNMKFSNVNILSATV